MSGESVRRSMAPRLAVAAASFGVVLALTYGVYGPVLDVRPLSGDNLYILDWADRTPLATALGTVDPDFYPEWRPLAYATVWLQYRWAGLDHVKSYSLVNMVLWAVCAWLVYRLVLMLAHSAAAGLLAAWFVIADSRPLFAVAGIIERQSSLACCFGLLAMLCVLGSRKDQLTRLECAGVLLLLLAAAFSKEYGLAFAGAVAAHALVQHQGRVAVPAVVAVVTYVGLRMALAEGAMGSYCEETGYFFAVRGVCYDSLSGTAVSQSAYNVMATLSGIVLPGLFTGIGQIAVSPRWLAKSVLWLAVATLGCWKNRRSRSMTLSLVGFNAALSLLLYRDRNQLPALVGFATAVGVGLAALDEQLQARGSRRIRTLAAALLIALLTVQSIRTRALVLAEVADLLEQDPCGAFGDFPHLDADFVKHIKSKYGMSNPGCVE